MSLPGFTATQALRYEEHPYEHGTRFGSFGEGVIPQSIQSWAANFRCEYVEYVFICSPPTPLDPNPPCGFFRIDNPYLQCSINGRPLIVGRWGKTIYG